MICIFLIENFPWVFWTSLGQKDYMNLGHHVGEWMWVGRES
jgi:hypothetical protein